MKFLPIKLNKLEDNEALDFVLVTGDAYVDHPSFGAAIIGRLLESHGYSVGIIAQPDWKQKDSFKTLGRPRLGFLVTGGNIDSMVNHYTVAKKTRQKDLYSPGGKVGLRPDRAAIVYGNKIRETFGDIPIILGGLEASLRRLSHYDYWSNKVRRSILLDSAADILVYGMGEKQIIEIADALKSGLPISELSFIRGTVYKNKNIENVYDYILLPTYQEVSSSKEKYAYGFMQQYKNSDATNGKTLIEQYDNIYIVQNPPMKPLSHSELDSVYNLPFVRDYHPIYKDQGGVPAIEEVKFSIISNRGCFGNCNFCALAFHQGRVVQSRSHQSIICEAETISWMDDFKGYIHDVGGPTANFRNPACKKQLTDGACKEKQCLFPTACKNLIVDHSDYLTLLKKLRVLPRIRKVFIRSGIRFDYLIYDKNENFFHELIEHHISGQLKVAPEHISAAVLEKMGKPHPDIYKAFLKRYNKLNSQHQKKQFIIPYLMSSHPGCTLTHALELAEYLRDSNTTPEQVQDFYPTPGTLSTCMYYTELDPRTMKPLYVAKHPHEKAMQRALIQYKLPQNHHLVLEALKKANRIDLIGFDAKSLIRPRPLNFKSTEGKNPPNKSDYSQHKKRTSAKQVEKKTLRNVHKRKSH